MFSVLRSYYLNIVSCDSEIIEEWCDTANSKIDHLCGEMTLLWAVRMRTSGHYSSGHIWALNICCG